MRHAPHHPNQYAAARNDAGIAPGFSPRQVVPSSKRVSGKSAVAAIAGVGSVLLAFNVTAMLLPLNLAAAVLGGIGLVCGLQEHRRSHAAEVASLRGTPVVDNAPAEGAGWLAIGGMICGALGFAAGSLESIVHLASALSS